MSMSSRFQIGQRVSEISRNFLDDVHKLLLNKSQHFSVCLKTFVTMKKYFSFLHSCNAVIGA